MGASFSVELKLMPKDEAETIKAINDFIDDMTERKCARFWLEETDRNNLEDLVKVIITDRSYERKGDLYMTDFDASYGWESVMTSFFLEIGPTLEDGSSLRVYVWDADDEDYIEVQNGKAEWIH